MPAETALLYACRVLFGPDVEISREFLHYLQPNGVKTAYRQRAKESHPDRSHLHDPLQQRRQLDRFREATEAYKLVCTYVRLRDTRPVRQERTSPFDTLVQAHRARTSVQSFHDGPVPEQPLELGRFLYFRGIVSEQTLKSALSWQQRQRPSFGRIARSWGWLSAEAIETILYCQDQNGPFGEKAIRLGYLTGEQTAAILSYQQTRQKRLGHYFILLGCVTAQQLEALLLDLHAHNNRLSAPVPPPLAISQALAYAP